MAHCCQLPTVDGNGHPPRTHALYVRIHVTIERRMVLVLLVLLVLLLECTAWVPPVSIAGHTATAAHQQLTLPSAGFTFAEAWVMQLVKPQRGYLPIPDHAGISLLHRV